MTVHRPTVSSRDRLKRCVEVREGCLEVRMSAAASYLLIVLNTSTLGASIPNVYSTRAQCDIAAAKLNYEIQTTAMQTRSVAHARAICAHTSDAIAGFADAVTARTRSRLDAIERLLKPSH
jgi:hypothetical protein